MPVLLLSVKVPLLGIVLLSAGRVMVLVFTAVMCPVALLVILSTTVNVDP